MAQSPNQPPGIPTAPNSIIHMARHPVVVSTNSSTSPQNVTHYTLSTQTPPAAASSDNSINGRPLTRHGRVQRTFQMHSEDFNWIRQHPQTAVHEETHTSNFSDQTPALPPTRSTMTIRGTNINLYSPMNGTNALSPDGASPMQAQAAASPRSPERSAYTRPQFRSKVVCHLDCKYCGQDVCNRGMKAILLADMAVELFSTDLPPENVELVNDDYQTKNCYCRIRDIACCGCGNVIGYHVTQPCHPCMEACNNGHFWMFHVDHVNSSDRTMQDSSKPLVWANIPRPDRERKVDKYDVMCR